MDLQMVLEWQISLRHAPANPAFWIIHSTPRLGSKVHVLDLKIKLRFTSILCTSAFFCRCYHRSELSEPVMAIRLTHKVLS